MAAMARKSNCSTEKSAAKMNFFMTYSVFEKYFLFLAGQGSALPRSLKADRVILRRKDSSFRRKSKENSSRGCVAR